MAWKFTNAIPQKIKSVIKSIVKKICFHTTRKEYSTEQEVEPMNHVDTK